MYVLEMKNISKSFSEFSFKNLRKKERIILNDISLKIEEGTILGFLGPNGSGKTTTIKVITGLLKATSGKVYICGKDINKNPKEALKNINAIVESPSFFEYLSGYKNIELIANIRNVSKGEIGEVIKLVDLTERINDKVSTYSLGMKQRLGLACCLIGNPKIIILDEPTNGLDPMGIVALRNIIKNIRDTKNVAIFISSHLIAEIEQICDKVIYLKEGKIVANKDVVEEKKYEIYKFEFENENSNEILNGISCIIDFKNINNKTYRVKVKKDDTKFLMNELILKGLVIESFDKIKETLEEDFIQCFTYEEKDGEK